LNWKRTEKRSRARYWQGTLDELDLERLNGPICINLTWDNTEATPLGLLCRPLGDPQEAPRGRKPLLLRFGRRRQPLLSSAPSRRPARQTIGVKMDTTEQPI
jgi:hypothetical protein